MLISPVAMAEFYKYYDEQGNVHFTDDYNNVPEDQRKEVEGFNEVISDETDTMNAESAGEPSKESEEARETVETEVAEDTEETEADFSAETADNSENTAAESSKYDFEGKIKEFGQRKDELAQEYEELMKQNSELVEEKKKAKTAVDIQRYNERAADLNRKFKEHDGKRKQLFSEVEDHNTKVSEENARRQKRQADRKKQ
jgi:hypothetical protein